MARRTKQFQPIETKAYRLAPRLELAWRAARPAIERQLPRLKLTLATVISRIAPGFPGLNPGRGVLPTLLNEPLVKIFGGIVRSVDANGSYKEYLLDDVSLKTGRFVYPFKKPDLWPTDGETEIEIFGVDFRVSDPRIIRCTPQAGGAKKRVLASVKITVAIDLRSAGRTLRMHRSFLDKIGETIAATGGRNASKIHDGF